MTEVGRADKSFLTIGFIVNPIAGIGGSLGLKGSDELAAMDALPVVPHSTEPSRSMNRAQRTLALLMPHTAQLRFACWGGVMGQAVLDSLGLHGEILGEAENENTGAGDTQLAARAMVAKNVDIIVFVGGDGTARDIFDAVGENYPVLGIPAGVKMHSGVFAVSPEAAGELLVQLVEGGLVGLAPQEVRDIDERAFRENIVKSRFYGEMLVPAEARYLQHTKVGGVENSELAAADIAAWVVETMEEGVSYVIGPGSTTAAIMEQLGLAYTLLGVDVVLDGELLLLDGSEQELLLLLTQNTGAAKIIVTVIGGQGHVFGRGNQQISPKLIRLVGVENIQIVAAKAKISALQGRPLLLDTNDPQLDLELSGYRSLITGYQDKILYRLATRA